MIIHDYYLYKKRELKDLEVEVAEAKKEILEKIKEGKDINIIYPKSENLQNFPQNSAFIKIKFTLKKPYTSKDEGEFHIMDNRICENPIVRDKFTGFPMVKPTTWKGHLRFAAERVEWNNKEEKEQIIKRLFGSEPEEKETLKGRLYFFPTFFQKNSEKDVITPLKRETRTPARGPIFLEVIKKERQGEFCLLYFPYPRDKNYSQTQVYQDLIFLTDALKLMFYTYGFSAKKTSGFGVIQETCEGKLWIKVKNNVIEKNFSNLNDLKIRIK